MAKNLFITITSKDGSKHDSFATNGIIDSSIFGCSVSLNSVTYSMALYEPDHFSADLSLSNKSLTFAQIREAIIGGTAKIFFAEAKADDKLISFNLFVYKVTPKYTKDNNISVKLDIYSLDKLMDIQKYSQAYTAKRLGQDIIASEISTFDKPGYGLTVNLTPRLMGYTLTDDTSTTPTPREIIQPYTVQYNETFRSMLNRVANRCGEFLYWHDGRLQYGLPTEETTLAENQMYCNIQEIADEITESAADSEDFTALAVTKSHRDGTGKVDAAYISAGDQINSKPYDLEIGSPDFNKTLGFVDKPRIDYKQRPMGATFGVEYVTDTDDEKKWNTKDWDESDSTQFWIDTVFKFANAGCLSEFAEDWITGFMVDSPLENLTDMKSGKVSQRKQNHRPIEGDDKDIYVGFSIDEQATSGFNDSVKDSLFESEKAENNRSVSHFGTHAKAYSNLSGNDLLDKNTLLGQSFYAAVQTNGQNASKNAIDIKIVANTEKNLHIGQIVTLNNTEQEYIITRIDGAFSNDSQNPNHDVHVTVHAIPVTVIKNSKYYIAEPIEQNVRVMDGNSTAIITDTDDPFKQGRVRVRFTWQNDKVIELNAIEVVNCDFKALKSVFSEKDDKFDKFTTEDYKTLRDRYLATEIIDNKANAYKNFVKSIVITPTSDSEKPYFKVSNVTFAQGSTLSNGLYSTSALKYCGGTAATTEDKKIDYAKFLENSAEDHKIAVLTIDNNNYYETDIDSFLARVPDLKKDVKENIEKLTKQLESYDKDTQEYKDVEAALNKATEKKAILDKASESVTIVSYSTFTQPASKVAQYKQAYKAEINAATSAKQTKEYRKDSTPWIRMTSPMAGNNNKLFMTPTPNTEVLIGFENGNPERPYVVGSLFNGSNKAGKNFSIQSVNETGMSISDENVGWDDILSMVALPIFTTVTKTASSMIQGKNLVDGKMPMGGKIVFKDKFGFYNMTMSSKSRKVSIDCPLGKISLSAFSGITISAPNGNIKIEGKNVSITAGDKLTLKSGTNKDIFDSETNDITGFFSNLIGKMAVNAATSFIGSKALDLSMIRSFWEVMFRPLNGTMSVKSNRHLLLEAGKGKAELPIDAMKAKDPLNVVTVFPNYPYFLIQQFFKDADKKLTEKITAVQTAYNAIRVFAHRATDTDLDGANRPTQAKYAEKTTGDNRVDPAILSEAKIKQIFENCVTKTANGWECTTDDATLKKHCPYPEQATGVPEIPEVGIWLNTVKDCAAKFVSLRTALEDASVKFTGGAKLIAAIKKVSKSVNVTIDNTAIDIKTIKYYEKSDANKTEKELKVSELGDISKYKEIEFTGLTLDSKRKLYYDIINVLFNAGLVAHIDKGETIKNGQTRYALTKTLPVWQAATATKEAGPEGYCKSIPVAAAGELGWDDFINHIKPADSVEDENNSYTGDIFRGIGSSIADAAKDWIDWDNISWIASQERNLWDTNAHPGMILMSDDNGGKTASFTGSGNALEIKPNHSLKSVISLMANNKISNADSTEDFALYHNRWTMQSNLKDNNLTV